MDAVSEKWRVFNRTNVLVWYSFAKQLIKSQANLICIRVNSVTNQVLPFRAASFDLSRPVHCRVPTANTEIFGRCFGLFSTISFYDLFMDRPQFFRENLFHSFVIAQVENSLKIELSWMNLSFIGKSDKLCVSKRAFSRSAEREGASCFGHWFRISTDCGSSFHVGPLTSAFRSAAVANLPDSVRLSGCRYKSAPRRPHLGGGADSHRQAHYWRLFGTFQLNDTALTKPSFL